MELAIPSAWPVATGIVTFFVSLVLAWIARFYHIVYQYRRFPGPKPTLLVGNAALVHEKVLPEVYMELAKEYGGLFCIFMGPLPVLVVSDCDIAREVMVKKFGQFYDRPLVPLVSSKARMRAIDSGLLRARFDLWTKVRAAVNPVFHSKSLSEYAATMNTAADALVTNIVEASERPGPTELSDATGKMTMRVVFECALGVDAPIQVDGVDHPAIKASKTVFRETTLTGFWVFLMLCVPSFLTQAVRSLAIAFGDFRNLTWARDVIYSMADQLCRSFCKAHGLPPFQQDKAVIGQGLGLQVFPPDTVPRPNSVLGVLMSAKTRTGGDLLQPYQVLDQASTIVLAGHETTSTAVVFTVYLLARNPDVETKLLQEIDAHGRETLPTYETLDDWPYAKAVFQESLRMFPVAPIPLRQCCADGVVVGGIPVPKGTNLHFNIMAMHRNPECFPDPDTFRPERFIEAAAQGNPGLHRAFMPFGLGPHNCVGYKFAMEEGVLMIIRMYQKFVFRLSNIHHPDGALPLKFGITISPKDGLWVKATPR